MASPPRAATRAPPPPNSSPAPTRDPSPGHFLFLLPLSLMPIGGPFLSPAVLVPLHHHVINKPGYAGDHKSPPFPSPPPSPLRNAPLPFSLPRFGLSGFDAEKRRGIYKKSASNH